MLNITAKEYNQAKCTKTLTCLCVACGERVKMGDLLSVELGVYVCASDVCYQAWVKALGDDVYYQGWEKK
jgi:hypothetical protein